MINNILHSRPVFAMGVAVAVLAGALATSAQADHHKDKKKNKSTVTSEVEGKGFLGVQMQELTDEMREGLNISSDHGVLISTVVDDSPAAQAGLREGDIVVRFDGKQVDKPQELRDLVAATEVGSEVKIKVIRDNKEETINVTIGDWKDAPGFDMGDFRLDQFDWENMPRFVHALMPRRLGVSVSTLDENLAPYFGVDKGDGLLVLSVSDESMAKEMGIQSGDVITEVAGTATDSSDDVRDALHAVDEGETFAVKVVRNKKPVTLEGTMREDDTSVRVRNALRWQDAPRVHIDHGERRHNDGNQELRKELDQLRTELDALKDELKKSRR